MEDKDFKQRYTRDEFEALVRDLFVRVAKPAQDALRMAELSPVRTFMKKIAQLTALQKQIDTVVLMGGGTRMVGVQEALRKALDGCIKGVVCQ